MTCRTAGSGTLGKAAFSSWKSFSLWILKLCPSSAILIVVQPTLCQCFFRPRLYLSATEKRAVFTFEEKISSSLRDKKHISSSVKPYIDLSSLVTALLHYCCQSCWVQLDCIAISLASHGATAHPMFCLTLLHSNLTIIFTSLHYWACSLWW